MQIMHTIDDGTRNTAEKTKASGRRLLKAEDENTNSNAKSHTDA